MLRDRQQHLLPADRNVEHANTTEQFYFAPDFPKARRSASPIGVTRW